MSVPATVLKQLDADHDHAVARLADLLTIPSVSTDPAYKPHMTAATDWLRRDLASLGFAVDVVSEKGGHPSIIARSTDAIVAEGVSRRVLFYGHYDVQPPDPIDKWTTPPFTPTLRDSMTAGDGPALYARGACDDKGQVMAFVEALRAYRATNTPLPVHVTLLIEGEEECGSKTLPAILESRLDDLRADVALVSDTAMYDATTVAICYGLRGLVYFDVKLHGPNRDLHSGVYGGTIPNPATILTRTLAKLWDEHHRIAIPGFYDDVAPLSDEERAAWAKLGFDESKYAGEIGTRPFGEKGYSTLERRWSRPCCDINGIYGGYTGAGAKTVIPSFAGAKVSFRIPGNMTPGRVQQQFETWLHAQDVAGCRWEIERHGGASPVLVPRDSPDVAAAQRAIQAVTGKPAALIREGATIPVIADLQQKLGLNTLLIGLGLNHDNLHSPDEHFATRRLLLGAKVHAAVLWEAAGGGRPLAAGR